jgi:hypothetical protein
MACPHLLAGQVRGPGQLSDLLWSVSDSHPGLLRGPSRPDTDAQAGSLLGASGTGWGALLMLYVISLGTEFSWIGAIFDP